MPLTKETPYPHDSMFHFLCLEHIFTFLPSRHYPQSFSVKSHFYNYLLIFRFKKFTLIYFPYKNSRLRIGLSIVPRLHEERSGPRKMEQREAAPSGLNPLGEALLCSLFQDCLLHAEAQDHPRSLGKESQRKRSGEGGKRDEEGGGSSDKRKPTNQHHRVCSYGINFSSQKSFI